MTRLYLGLVDNDQQALRLLDTLEEDGITAFDWAPDYECRRIYVCFDDELQGDALVAELESRGVWVTHPQPKVQFG